MEYSINTFNKLIETCIEQNKKIYEIMQEKEAYDFEITIDKVRAKTYKTIEVMKTAIKKGIESTEKSYSGLCGDDANRLYKHFQTKKSLFGNVFEKIVSYSIATTEENLRMNKIAACPTAGSCGIVPAVLISLSEEYHLQKEEEINALITAGAIGYVISSKVPMAGAVAGCQAECGTASAMAAALTVQILGGSNEQSINASVLAIKNVLGLTCDPVAGLVEIPCIKRNAFLAVHAITAAELSIADVKTKIPPDEIVDAMLQTGQLIPHILKETSLGGLAMTKKGKEINKRIDSQRKVI